jgi:hypothetical protein
MKGFKLYVVLAVVAAAVMAPAAFAQTSANATANANANIVPGISITNTAALNFGDFLVPGAAGTATVDPAGVRTTALTTAGGTVTAAAFTVSGAGLKTFDVAFGAPSITITSAANSMTVDQFTPSCDPCTFGGTAATLTTLPLTVGGRLNVNASQPIGAYTGTFSVIVTYQ